jgi:hypothetical protein
MRRPEPNTLLLLKNGGVMDVRTYFDSLERLVPFAVAADRGLPTETKFTRAA